MARGQGDKPDEDASFKSLLARLDNGGEPNAAGPPVVPAPSATIPPQLAPQLHTPAGQPLAYGKPASGLAAAPDIRPPPPAVWSQRSPALVWGGLALGVVAVGVIWLMLIYWSATQHATFQPDRRSAPGQQAAANLPSAKATIIVVPLSPHEAPAAGGATGDSAAGPAVSSAVRAQTVQMPLRDSVPANPAPVPDLLPPRAAASSALPPTPAAPEAKLLVAPSSRAQAGEGAPFAIKVASASHPIDRLYVVISGLPSGAFLSAGTAVSPGVWRVQARGLDSLLLRLPLATREDVPLDLELFDSDGHGLAQARTLIQVMAMPPAVPAPAMVAVPPVPSQSPPPVEAAPRPQPPAVTPPGAAAPLPSVAAAPPPPRLSMDDETALIERGRLLARNGDIAGARHLFERAADAGSGRAALLMGETYDPDILAGLRVLGVRGDATKARQWYARAGELGVAVAAERLRALAGR